MKRLGGFRFDLLLLLLSVLLLLFLCTFGSAELTLSQVIAAAGYRFFGVGERVGNHGAIVYLRLMRTLLAYVTGAALSVSGASMQAVFSNPLADPHILGVSSGAALGAAIATIFCAQTAVWGLSTVSLFAFVGGLLAALCVLFVARVGGQSGTTGLLLSGVAMGAFLSAMLSGLLAVHRDSAESVYMWTMGSFSAATGGKVCLTAAVTLACVLLLLSMSREMDLLLLGDAQAQSLGVRVTLLRGVLLTIATLMTACVVSVSGVIGFVGLMVPHAVRRVTGANHKRLIPACALAGGMFLMTADTAARSLLSYEIPVGVLTSLLGGPFFLFLLRKHRSGEGDKRRA